MTWSGGTASWGHTNVWAAGALIATYSPNGSQTALNFHFTDWLGTRRVLTDSAGNNPQYCASLPFGNGENCPATPTEHLFTQKERDAETNNDYFGARYYSSFSGRFLTPDWSAKVEPVPYAKMDNPQSLNLYAYVDNNPLSRIDADGHFGSGILSSLWAAITGNEGGTNLNGTEEFAAVNLGGNGTQQQEPVPPPMAMLHTSIKGGYTTFEWTDKNGKVHEDKIQSLVRADHRSKPGAADPFHSYVVGQIKGMRKPAYGPAGAQIDTGDSRGRWVHGGGTSLGIHAYDPHQRLTPTFGCTRACNADVQRLGGEITNFQKANPNDPTPIPYWRTEQ